MFRGRLFRILPLSFLLYYICPKQTNQRLFLASKSYPADMDNAVKTGNNSIILIIYMSNK